MILSSGSQLGLAKKYSLPLFLHSRAAHADFVQILRDEGFGENGGRAEGAKGGVVHSFTGTPEQARELVGSSPRYRHSISLSIFMEYTVDGYGLPYQVHSMFV